MMASVRAIIVFLLFGLSLSLSLSELHSFPDSSFFFRCSNWCRAISDRENGGERKRRSERKKERERGKKLTGLSLVPSIDSLQGPVKSAFVVILLVLTCRPLEFFLPLTQTSWVGSLSLSFLSLVHHSSPMAFLFHFWNCKPIHRILILIFFFLSFLLVLFYPVSLIVSLFNSLFQL